jgi:predicted site-specific integrase-resolvase
MTICLPYPPPWQDIATLCAHLCISPTTVEVWVKRGFLPPPKLRGGKRLWKWKDVEKCLEDDAVTGSSSADEEADRIRHATRQAIAESR